MVVFGIFCDILITKYMYLLLRNLYQYMYCSFKCILIELHVIVPNLFDMAIEYGKVHVLNGKIQCILKIVA